eukprot:6295428-Lingulodinium_polyedra.AAC.1
MAEVLAGVEELRQAQPARGSSADGHAAARASSGRRRAGGGWPDDVSASCGAMGAVGAEPQASC